MSIKDSKELIILHKGHLRQLKCFEILSHVYFEVSNLSLKYNLLKFYDEIEIELLWSVTDVV